MNGVRDDDSVAERQFCEKILSGSFTLLGLLIGFYGVINSWLAAAGPSESQRVKLLPFLHFLSGAIVLDCMLGILAVLGVAGYLRVRVVLTVLSCALLALVGTFIVARSLQLSF